MLHSQEPQPHSPNDSRARAHPGQGHTLDTHSALSVFDPQTLTGYLLILTPFRSNVTCTMMGGQCGLCWNAGGCLRMHPLSDLKKSTRVYYKRLLCPGSSQPAATWPSLSTSVRPCSPAASPVLHQIASPQAACRAQLSFHSLSLIPAASKTNTN